MGDHIERINAQLDAIKIDSIDVMRQKIDRHTAQLDGSNGGVALNSIVEKFREVSTLVSFGKALGLGTVGTLILIVFGLQQAKPLSPDQVEMKANVESQRQQIAELKGELSKLEGRVFSIKK